MPIQLVSVLKQGVAQRPYLLEEQFAAASVETGFGIRWVLSFNPPHELAQLLS